MSETEGLENHTLRLAPSELQRADRVAKLFNIRGKFIDTNRSQILRLAIKLGLDRLEKELAK